MYVASWLLLLESVEKQGHSIDLTFSGRSTTKCTTKPVSKILDKLALEFEAATASKAAFYSFFNSTSDNFSDEKTHVNAEVRSVYTEYTLFLSPLGARMSLPSLGISF